MTECKNNNCGACVDDNEISDQGLCEKCEAEVSREAWGHEDFSFPTPEGYDEEYDYGEEIDPQEKQAINQAVKEINRQQGRGNL